MKKSAIILSIAAFAALSIFICEWCLYSGGFKRLYYNFFSYDGDKVRVVEDDNFLFYEDDYSKTYTLNSSYYVPHRILLIPESKTVPIDFEYTGEFLVEILDRDDNLLKSTNVDKFKSILRRKESKGGDYFNNYLIYAGKQPRDAGSVFAFEIGEIPFDLVRLKWGRLKNMRIRVTVANPDNALLEYCDKATLIVIPDLRM